MPQNDPQGSPLGHRKWAAIPHPQRPLTGHRYGTRRGSWGAGTVGEFRRFQGQQQGEVGVAETENLNS
ncbi:MAG: hypothetical protein Q7U50_11495 [Candidatus Nitrotoga sp.]|nr:hypothetical protein [Candidatus Nitrotoga sp.]